MGQKHKRFRESRIPLRDIRKNPRSMYARVPQAMAQFVLKIEKLSHIIGPTPILEMTRAYGLRPRLWLLMRPESLIHAREQINRCSEFMKLTFWMLALGGYLMVCALVCMYVDQAVWVSSPGRRHSVEFLGKTLYSHRCLSLSRCINGYRRS